MKQVVVYLEVFNTLTAENFLLYIPSKYEISTDGVVGNDIYKISYIKINENGYIPGDYGGEPDDYELQKQYEEVDVNFTPDLKRTDLTERLEHNYNYPVALKDIGKDDVSKLREIFRQLRRLKLCVQNVKYKVCIIYKSYMCCIRRDDTFEAFKIKNYSNEGNRRLYVSLDLETLYKKIDSVEVDIQTIRESIHRVLNKNQVKNAMMLRKMMKQKEIIDSFSENVYEKTKAYTDCLSKLEDLLKKLVKSENEVLINLDSLDRKYDNPDLKGIHNDIERTHQKSQTEDKLNKIKNVKQELIQNIIDIRCRQEDLTLRVDVATFDCAIMIDAVMKKIMYLAKMENEK